PTIAAASRSVTQTRRRVSTRGSFTLADFDMRQLYQPGTRRLAGGQGWSRSRAPGTARGGCVDGGGWGGGAWTFGAWTFGGSARGEGVLRGSARRGSLARESVKGRNMRR